MAFRQIISKEIHRRTGRFSSLRVSSPPYLFLFALGRSLVVLSVAPSVIQFFFFQLLKAFLLCFSLTDFEKNTH